MPPVMQSFTHKLEFTNGAHSYSVATSFRKDGDTFAIRTDKGASCTMRQTPTSLTMNGVDEQRRRFALTLTVAGNEVSGELRLGRKRFQAKGPANQVMRTLSTQVAQSPRIKASLPQSTAIASLADLMRKNTKVVPLLVGVAKKPAGRKTYCESICDCCAGGGTFTPWCCISCASCDIFGMDLAQKFQMVVT